MADLADDLGDELFALAGGEEEAEEGEASSVAASSPNSLGSGAMDESDSERDEPDVPAKDSDVPYPLEGKYINAKDKAHINSLPQLERERILGERAETMQTLRFQNELKRKVQQIGSKRKASSMEPEDATRASNRQKVPKKNDRLEAYKRDREQRGQQRQRNDDRRNGRRRSSSASRGAGSDLDAEGESEVEFDEQVNRASAREEQPAELMHFDYVRVSRGLFGKICFYPGFEEAVKGTYARIGTGQDAQRRTLYKMAQIKGIKSGKPYVFEGKDGQRIGTDQYVIAQHGSATKEYTFSFLSNQGFTESDLETYRQSLAETGSKFPTQAFLKKKFEDIERVKNMAWTDAAISEKLERQNKYSHLVAGSGTSLLNKPHTESQEHARRLAELNAKNRKQDSERIRKALIEERKQAEREKKQREKEFQERKRKREEEEAKKKAAEEKKANSLKVPNIDALFDGSDRSRSATPAVLSRSGTPKPGEKKEVRKGLPTFRKPKMDDDIIASIDFGIDIDI